MSRSVIILCILSGSATLSAQDGPPPRPLVELAAASDYGRQDPPIRAVDPTNDPDTDAFETELSRLSQELQALRELRHKAQAKRELLRQTISPDTLKKQTELRNLLIRVLTGGRVRVPTSRGAPPPPSGRRRSDQGTGSEPGDAIAVDPVAAGKTLFLLKKYDEAEKKFRIALIPPDKMEEGDVRQQLTIKYMIASCQRQQGKTNKAKLDEAKQSYQEIIDSTDQDKYKTLTDYSKWQIKMIDEQQSLETLLQEIQTFRKELLDPGKSSTEPPASDNSSPSPMP